MSLRLRLGLASVALAGPLLVALTWLRVEAAARAEEDTLVQRGRQLMDLSERSRCEQDPSRWAELRSAPPPPLSRLPQVGGPMQGPGGPMGGGPVGGPVGGPMGGGPREWGDGPPDGPPDDEPPPRPGGWPRRPGAPRGPGGPGGRFLPAELYPYSESMQTKVAGAPELSPELTGPLQEGAGVTVRRWRQGDARVIDVLLRSPGASRGACAVVLVRRHTVSVATAVLAQLPAGLWPVGLVAAVMVLGLGPVVRRIRRLERQVRASAQSGYTTPVDENGSDELTELARSFNAAASEVRQQMDAQQQREDTLRAFVDNTTHDLMTPLTVLTGHLVDLADAARAGHPAGRPVVEAALTEAHYIGSLLHNLGAAARLEAGEPQMRRDEVALGPLVERAVLRLRPIARLRQVELVHAVPPDAIAVVGDVTLIEQAVSNVVQNAVKHNHPGGHVAVVLEGTSASFTLDVIDDGPGIADQDVERLLQRRERGDSARSRDPEGQGLGLAIARRVSDTHGWTMSLLRSEFGGLQVRFAGGRDSRH